MLCLLCAAGAGFAARDIALDLTGSVERARLIGLGTAAALVAALALVIVLGRRQR